MRSFVSGKFVAFIGGAAALLLVSGCATMPPADDPEAVAEFQQLNDPLEPMNRVFFTFNDGVDTMFLRPVSGIYRDATPQFAQDRVTDFLANLKSPVIFLNDVLQGNMGLAGETVTRFALNTTFGVLGLMDVAAPMGFPKHSADFGQTLGVWGVEEGPYLVWPLLGPSNPRDTVGIVADTFSDPFYWYLKNEDLEWVIWTRAGVSAVSTRANYFDFIDNIRETSLDPYATVRGLYRQSRASDILKGRNGQHGVRSMVPSENASNPY